MAAGRRSSTTPLSTRRWATSDGRTTCGWWSWSRASLRGAIGRSSRRGLARPWAALAALAIIVYPASDSLAFWPVGAIGMFIVGLVVAAALLELRALRTDAVAAHRDARRQRADRVLLCLHVRDRDPTGRIDVAAVTCRLRTAARRAHPRRRRYGDRRRLAVYRTAVPYPPDVSFTVERTIGESDSPCLASRLSCRAASGARSSRPARGWQRLRSSSPAPSCWQR